MVSLSELLTVRALMLFYVVCSTIDSSWDRSSPSLWSTSYYTSDSARSSPVISPAIQRRHLPKPAPPPKPKSKPIPIMGSKSLPEADTLSNFTTPSASPGSSSKGLDLFFRQMEKISKLGSDEQGRWFRGHAWIFLPSPILYCLSVPFWCYVLFFELDLSSAWQWIYYFLTVVFNILICIVSVLVLIVFLELPLLTFIHIHISYPILLCEKKTLHLILNLSFLIEITTEGKWKKPAVNILTLTP